MHVHMFCMYACARVLCVCSCDFSVCMYACVEGIYVCPCYVCICVCVFLRQSLKLQSQKYKEGNRYPASSGQLAINRKKNRFKDILPCE